jgi:hypothetical protein
MEVGRPFAEGIALISGAVDARLRRRRLGDSR